MPFELQVALRYLLATLPPANWYPLIPRAADPDARRLLARGTLRRDDNTPILPAGRLLEPGAPLELFDEEVPRVGVRVVREWQMGRAPDAMPSAHAAVASSILANGEIRGRMTASSA